MASHMRAINAIEQLARSEARVHLLNAIRNRGTVESHALREVVDADRTTIQRNLDALEEAGWIDHEYGTGYTLTPCGELIATEFFEFAETMQAGLKLQPVFRWLAPTDVDLNLRQFADAEVVRAEEHDPYAPVNRHIELMAQADHFRGLLPSVGLQPLQTAREYVVEHGAEQEFVVSHGVAETIRAKPAYAQPVTAMLETGRCTLYETSEELPYYLGLAGPTTQIGIEDEHGKPQALIESDAPAVAEWGQDTYAAYEAGAESFQPPPDCASA